MPIHYWYYYFRAAKPILSPQDLMPIQNDCTLKLSWTMLEDLDINHYLITIRSGNTTTRISGSSHNMTRYGPLTVSMYWISISAVNRCGREAPPQGMRWRMDQSKCCMIDMEPKPCRSDSMNAIGML